MVEYSRIIDVTGEVSLLSHSPYLQSSYDLSKITELVRYYTKNITKQKKLEREPEGKNPRFF